MINELLEDFRQCYSRATNEDRSSFGYRDFD